MVVSDSPSFVVRMISERSTGSRMSSLASWRNCLATRAARSTIVRSPKPSSHIPSTGLPVLAMPSTTRPVQFGSTPITTTAAMLGFDADADQGAERELQVVAELEPAERVWQGEGARDQRGDPLGGRVREVVDRQDRDVVAGADRPVGPTESGQATLFCHRALLTLWMWT